ncbi:MAG: zinc dependent phospholipase C family protein [Clostridiaceae bacterium]|nr:zinc dependent phospholipase C family protein [Clostridiaceae bacterium]
MSAIENAYGKTFGTVLWAVNPLKKIFKKTLCQVHVFINGQAIEILKNDGFHEAYEFFALNKGCLNDGVVWADQDFRSREHFYNPYTQRGLYGCKSSKQLFRRYYGCALVHWDCGDRDKAMFYLGAAVHLIQDSTIPQHGSVKLLKSHSKYERWIHRVHDDFLHYSAAEGGIYLNSPFEYIDKNSKEAIEAYTKYSLIKDPSEKFFRIANRTFPLAQKTTAGCLMNFYNKINEE